MLTKNLKDRLYSYFINRWGMFDYTRGWLKGNCPFCGAENKFGVSLATNKSHCFKCEAREKPLLVVSTIENLDWGETTRFLRTINIDGLEYKDPSVIEYDRKPINLPIGFTLLKDGDDTLGILARKYMRKRGFDIKKLSHKGFGYCNEGPLFGYLIFPYYANGEMVYYTTRRLLSIGPKFDNPKIEDFGVGKSSLIYNIDAINMYRTIYVVESVLNAETIGDNALGFGGKDPSAWQKSALLKGTYSNMIIILDPDANLYAIDLALQLVNYKRVKTVLLPSGEDVNSFGRYETLLRVYRTRYQTYQDLIKLKHAIQRSEYTYN